jgi:hypothetical protein
VRITQNNTLLVIANLGKFLAELLKAGNRNILRTLKCVFCRHDHPSKKALLTKLDENGNEIDNDVGDGSTTFGLFLAFILYIGKNQ